jgi:hypothetical protein
MGYNALNNIVESPERQLQVSDIELFEDATTDTS